MNLCRPTMSGALGPFFKCMWVYVHPRCTASTVPSSGYGCMRTNDVKRKAVIYFIFFVVLFCFSFLFLLLLYLLVLILVYLWTKRHQVSGSTCPNALLTKWAKLTGLCENWTNYVHVLFVWWKYGYFFTSCIWRRLMQTLLNARSWYKPYWNWILRLVATVKGERLTLKIKSCKRLFR